MEATPDGISLEPDGVARCWWGSGDELYRPYHDREWGRPVSDVGASREAQPRGLHGGLSWLTILRKRENFRAAFANFEIDTVAGFGTDDVERLLADAGIVRHRGKIEAVINNARRCGRARDEFGSLAAYAWRYEPDPSTRPAVLDREALMQLPTSPESVAMSKDLRRRAGRSSGRRRSTRSWRRWASSTTTSSAARSASRWKGSGAPSDDRRAQALLLDPRLAQARPRRWRQREGHRSPCGRGTPTDRRAGRRKRPPRGSASRSRPARRRSRSRRALRLAARGPPRWWRFGSVSLLGLGSACRTRSPGHGRRSGTTSSAERGIRGCNRSTWSAYSVCGVHGTRFCSV